MHRENERSAEEGETFAVDSEKEGVLIPPTWGLVNERMEGIGEWDRRRRTGGPQDPVDIDTTSASVRALLVMVPRLRDF
ncbi:hypothetical protein ROHU_034739 [Labeo rohita]|nr:hypothetical protein ROHU_034739 [Labeo rohita]